MFFSKKPRQISDEERKTHTLFFNPRKTIFIRYTSGCWGYFQLKDYKIPSGIPLTNDRVINEFIKSDHFLWRNRRQQIAPFSSNHHKSIFDYNLHGLYDADKIVPSDFKVKSFESLKEEFFPFMSDKINGDSGFNHVQLEDEKSIAEIKKAIEECANVNGTYYILSVTDKDKIAKPGVYVYFFSAIIVDLKSRNFIAIEFGLD